jgi:glycosyltransferase involved in cell wall biosynthesis
MRLYLKALCESAGPTDEIDSVVLNDGPETDPRLPRYSTVALRSHSGCNRSKLRFIRETLRLAADCSRVVCGHLHQLPIVWLAQRLNPRLRYYLVAHGIEVWRPYSALEVKALQGAHRILCVSEYTRRHLLRFCPSLDPARLLVVPNTLDPVLAQSETSAVSATPFGVPRILTVARLTTSDTYKGVDTLIEALPLVRREYPSARLRIVGGGDDQPRLQALTHQHGVAAAVDFTGRIDDAALQSEYAACDIFALPSRKEGFGLVYLEAMIHGKPCLGARAGGAPEVINDDVGVLAEYGNIPEIAAALMDLVRYPRASATIRRHADSFAFAVFQRRLASVLA